MEISPPLKENGSWWQCRTRLERRLLLCATLAVLVACGFAIVMAAVIYRAQDSSKVPDIPTVAAFRETSNCVARDSVCNTPGCVLAAAHLLENMDKKVDPCEDFYSFACGGFEAKMDIPEHESSVNMHNLIGDKVTQRLRFLIERPIKEEDTKPTKLVKNLYQSCLNQTRLEEVELNPLKEILEGFGGWPVVMDDQWNETNFIWHETIYKFQRAGYSARYLINFSILPDLKNSSHFIVKLDQAVLDMLNKESLMKGLENKAVKAYLEYQIGLATLMGADESCARVQQTQALEFEIKLAKINLSHDRTSNLYNPMTIKELSSKVPGIPWIEYINNIIAPNHVLTEDERVNVVVPDYFPKLVDLLTQTPKRTLANYLMWRVSSDSVDYLNEEARNLQLKYTVTFSGMTVRKPRWKECTEFVSSSLGFAVSAMYVREYFDKNAYQLTKEIVDDIRTVFTEIIDEVEWLDNNTRIYAKKKAAAIKTHIAYPDELLNDKKLTDYYGNLTLNSNDYFRNVLNLATFYINNGFKNLRGPIKKNDWIFLRSSVVVNSFYSPHENSIQIPAGILQGSCFSKGRPAYLNYAAIGWLIGHEITHGFDDYGHQFSPDGNLVDWWEASTKKNYFERAQCIFDQYGNYTFPEIGLKINSINTLGENIADNGGIKEAYRGYIKWAGRQRADSENWDQVEQRLPGLSEYDVRQLFWLGAANVWCQKSRPEQLRSDILTSAHAPSRFRIIGTFSNMPQFASDFNCPVGSTMNPVRKCSVW